MFGATAVRADHGERGLDRKAPRGLRELILFFQESERQIQCAPPLGHFHSQTLESGLMRWVIFCCEKSSHGEGLLGHINIFYGFLFQGDTESQCSGSIRLLRTVNPHSLTCPPAASWGLPPIQLS